MSAHATGHASTRQSDGWANSKELPQRRGLRAFQTSQDEGGGGETSSLDLEPAGAYYPPALGGESDKWRPMLVTSCTEATPKHWAPCQPRVADSERAAIEYAEEVLYPDFEIPIPLSTKPKEDCTRWHELHLNEPHSIKPKVGCDCWHELHPNERHFINPKVDFARWHELHLYEPHFTNPEVDFARWHELHFNERHVWRSASSQNFLKDRQRAVYAGQHGQTLVFANATWQYPPEERAKWHRAVRMSTSGMPSRSNWATSCMSMQTQGYLHPVDLSNATATYESAILLSSPDSWSW
eukprot:gene5379-5599_t